MASVRSVLGMLSVGLIAAVTIGGCNTLLSIDESPLVRDNGGTGACLLDSDCSGNHVCLFRVCSTPCNADRDCDRNARCLKTETSAACVEDHAGIGACNAGATCPNGTECVEGKCRTRCATDRTLCLQDQLCGADGFCRGTDAAHDPNVGAGGAGSGGNAGAGGTGNNEGGTSGLAGTGGSPPSSDCENGSLRCDGAAQSLRSVCVEGTWQPAEPCADGFLCSSKSAPPGACEPIVPECFGREPHATLCQGSKLITCGPDLVTKQEEECLSAAHCTKGRDRCAPCLAGTHACDGHRLLKCRDDNSGYDELTSCSADLPCNADLGQCTKLICQSGDKRCSGDKLEQCNATLTGYEPFQTCKAGLCDPENDECDVCVPNSKICDNPTTVRTCSATGQSASNTICASPTKFCANGNCVQCLQTSDCPGAGACETVECQASTATCVKSPKAPGETCSGGVCDGKGQCVKCINAGQCTATNTCYTAKCTSNLCGQDPKGAGVACNFNGGSKCDGHGQCVQCTAHTDCSAPNSLCRSTKCVSPVHDVGWPTAFAETSAASPLFYYLFPLPALANPAKLKKFGLYSSPTTNGQASMALYADDGSGTAPTGEALAVSSTYLPLSNNRETVASNPPDLSLSKNQVYWLAINTGIAANVRREAKTGAIGYRVSGGDINNPPAIPSTPGAYNGFNWALFIEVEDTQ